MGLNYGRYYPHNELPTDARAMVQKLQLVYSGAAVARHSPRPSISGPQISSRSHRSRHRSCQSRFLS